MEEQFPGAEALQFVDELQEDISSFLLHKGSEAEILDALGGILCYGRPSDADDHRWGDALMDGLLRHPPRKSTTGDTSGQNRPTRPIFGAPPHSSSIHWPARPDARQSQKNHQKSAFSPAPATHNVMTVSEKASSSGSRDELGEARKVSSDSDLNAAPEAHEAAAQASQTTSGMTADAAAGVRTGRGSPQGNQSRSDPFNSLLEFTSCFESGNLRYAVFQPDEERLTYDLVLDNDVNTRGHTQWFYFALRGGQQGQKVRFRIINMSKSQSLFRQGMRPLAWSEARAFANDAAWACSSEEASECLSDGWRYIGDNVTYHRSKLGLGSYHTLSFDYTFESKSDTVYIAYCVPYTYSMSCTALQQMEQHPVKGQWCRRKNLCYTLGNLNCDVFCISNWSISKRLKKSVVVSARVHPGESNASWLVHGLLCFLLSHSAEAQVLRDRFVWYVVPMINPDGVVHGNYRCSLAGVDLNRQWRHPAKALHQNIYQMKKLIIKLKKKSDLCMFIDLHGHSRKFGIFSYCCANFPLGDERHFQVRMYPRLLSLLSPEFAFHNCRWRQGLGKRGTGRVVVAKDVGLVASYTIEASFFGASRHSKEIEFVEEHSDTEEDKDAGQEARSAKRFAKKGCESAFDQVVPFTPAKLQMLGADLARALLLQHNLGHEVWKVQKAHELWEQRFGPPLDASEEEVESRASQSRRCSSPTLPTSPGISSSSGEASRQNTPDLSGDSGDESGSATEIEADDAEVEDDGDDGSDVDSCDGEQLAADIPLDDADAEEVASALDLPVAQHTPMQLPVQCGADTPSTALPSSAPSSASLSPSDSFERTEAVPEACSVCSPKMTAAPKKKSKKKELVRRPIQPKEWLRSPVSNVFDTLGRYSASCCSECLACASGLQIPSTLVPDAPEMCLGIDANAVLSDLRAAGVPEDDNGSSSGSDSAPSEDNLNKDSLARIGRRLVRHSRRMRRSLGPSTMRRVPNPKKDSRKEDVPKRKSDGGTHRAKLLRTRSLDVSNRSSAQDVKRLVAFGQTTYVPSALSITENLPEPSRKEAAIPRAAIQFEEQTSLSMVKALPECRTASHPKGNAAISRSLLGMRNVTALFRAPKDRFAFLGEEQKVTARLGNRLANEGTALAGMLCIRTVNNGLVPSPPQDQAKKSSREIGITSGSTQTHAAPSKASAWQLNSLSSCSTFHPGSKDSASRLPPGVDGLGVQHGEMNSKSESQAAARNAKRRVPLATGRHRRSGVDIQLPLSSDADALTRELKNFQQGCGEQR
eukprot:gnl/MRDRNA2_/MRDRNA2_133087_c0_seq1.p1 gnl/MRDRNA2_/MRDRNA2_133087_c0~~gnl/MRDRNA2_/MRDRNA2_133087_c0_seq1.p1  ORF type:complete len:1267 (+),score=232.99 gnl/MRDRNA2_/MRDRNA2_133087_c0_seq1:84-3884(+)